MKNKNKNIYVMTVFKKINGYKVILSDGLELICTDLNKLVVELDKLNGWEGN